jgi:hypothetical protein
VLGVVYFVGVIIGIVLLYSFPSGVGVFSLFGGLILNGWLVLKFVGSAYDELIRNADFFRGQLLRGRKRLVLT